MDRWQIIGLSGSILLAFGTFCPVLSDPVRGYMNYFQIGKFYAASIILLAAFSFIAIFAKQYIWLWITGFGSISVMIITFIDLYTKMSDIRSKMGSQVPGNPFRGLADKVIQSIHLQWGWVLLIGGAVLITLAAAVKKT